MTDNKNVPAVRTLRTAIDELAPEISYSLPAHMSPEKFMKTVQTAVAFNPKVREAASTPAGFESLKIACAKAAQDGLVLDNKEAALVPFFDKKADGNLLQYMPMVAGKLKLMRNSGELKSLTVEIVYSNDEFEWLAGDAGSITHKPAKFGTPRGDPLGVYAIAFLKDGTIQREVMDREQIEGIAAQTTNGSKSSRYPSKNQYDPAEGLNWGEWWRKTVTHRIAKRLPSSSGKDSMEEYSDTVEDGFDYSGQAGTQPQPAATGGAAIFATVQNETQETVTEDGEVIEGSFENVSPVDETLRTEEDAF